jgi:hypothetical protein
MINWILARPDMKKFLARSGKKQQLIIAERQTILLQKRDELVRRVNHAEDAARHISLRRSRGASAQEITSLRSDMQEPIAGIYSILNDYTRDLLWLEIHRALAVKGFVLPEELTLLREDIDFGLLSLEEFEGIEEILEEDNDPFSEIEDSILREFRL